MVLAAIDSTHFVPPDELRRRDIAAVFYYLDTGGHRDDWKDLAPADAVATLDAGIGVGLIWEATAVAATQGEARGRAHGRLAVAAARRLGPRFAGATICWTVDTDVTGWSDVAAYGRGFTAEVRGGGYKAAPYGEASVVDGAVSALLAVAGWQTNAAGWTPGRRVSRFADVLQHLPVAFPGGDVDPDTIVNDNTTLVTWPTGHPRPDLPQKDPATMPLNAHDLELIDKTVGDAIDARLNPDGKGNLLVRIRNEVARQGPRSIEAVITGRKIAAGVRALLHAGSAGNAAIDDALKAAADKGDIDPGANVADV